MRVDRDRFARAGRAGDEQVRHLREVGDDGLPSRSLPSAIGSAARAIATPRLDQLAERHDRAPSGSALRRPRRPARNRRDDRIDGARIASARSSASVANCRTFTPGAGSISNCVTTGPVVRPDELAVDLEGAQRLQQRSRPAGRARASLRSVSCARGRREQVDAAEARPHRVMLARRRRLRHRLRSSFPSSRRLARRARRCARTSSSSSDHGGVTRPPAARAPVAPPPSASGRRFVRQCRAGRARRRRFAGFSSALQRMPRERRPA